MEGSDPKEKLAKTYQPALIKNWTVWPWVQLVNFKMVPLEHRVLVVNVVALGESQLSLLTYIPKLLTTCKAGIAI